jgi:formylglycine-generating enzyme required for sulfatase activity
MSAPLRNVTLTQAQRDRLFKEFVGEISQFAPRLAAAKGEKDTGPYSKGTDAARNLLKRVQEHGTFTVKTQQEIAGALNLVPVKFMARLLDIPKAAAPPLADPKSLKRYLKHVMEQFAELPLPIADSGSKDPNRKDKPELARVYIDLNTTTSCATELEARDRPGLNPERLLRRREVEARSLTVLEAAASNCRLVLLGAPGSGKSTFLRYLALCLASHAHNPKDKWIKRLAGWPADASGLVPVFLELRLFAQWLLKRSALEPRAGLLRDYLLDTLRDNALEGAAGQLEAALDAGQAIVFLDGLDEVPLDTQKLFVRDTVRKFAGHFAQCRFIVTCRTYSYRDQDWQLVVRDQDDKVTDFPAFELANFDQKKINDFIRGWYAEHRRLKRLDSEEETALKARSLSDAISAPALRELAGNPMLLTAMAHVHYAFGDLPNTRAKLYDVIINHLLFQWKAAGMRALLVEAGCDENDLKRKFAKLAWQAQDPLRNRPDGQPADINETELQDELKELHPRRCLNWTEKVIKTVKERAALLIEPTRHVFKFPHRSFQESLAGAHLADQSGFDQRAADLMDDSGYWREVIKWSAGRAAHVIDRPQDARDVIFALCPADAPVPTANLEWRKAILAGEVVLEMGSNKLRRLTNGTLCFESVQGRLAKLLELGVLPTAERAQAGVLLGKLGDPRPGAGLENGLPKIDWLPICTDANGFKMGGKGGYRAGEEFTCHLLDGQTYYLSRYPVTVAQYDAFVKAEGYEMSEPVWSKSGLKWRKHDKVTGPRDYSPDYQTDNHPRVGVSWHEAHAFANWLSAQLPNRPDLWPKDWPTQNGPPAVRLPHEWEWERAARHTDGRAYPWDKDGSVFTLGKNPADIAQRCNMSQSGIGHTSAVGLFPGGDAECGAADLIGNVWEWCGNPFVDYGNDPVAALQESVADEQDGKKRKEPIRSLCVLRGGSWGDGIPVGLLASSRRDYPPGLRDDTFGFRVVCVGGGCARSVAAG